MGAFAIKTEEACLLAPEFVGASPFPSTYALDPRTHCYPLIHD